MSIFTRKKSSTPQVQLRSGMPQPFGLIDSYVPLADGETRLYRSIREAVPVVDAAIMKISSMDFSAVLYDSTSNMMKSRCEVNASAVLVRQLCDGELGEYTLGEADYEH